MSCSHTLLSQRQLNFLCADFIDPGQFGVKAAVSINAEWQSLLSPTAPNFKLDERNECKNNLCEQSQLRCWFEIKAEVLLKA